jgi:glycosyltransferase involved in cell wall biosynthesis
MARQVVVCQIGAREHYAVPRVLHKAGLLKALITDAWVPPRSVLSGIPGQLGVRLRGRYHPELADARVIHFSGEALRRELGKIFARQAPRWDWLMSHNAWFQAKAVRALSDFGLLHDRDHDVSVLAYSYAARDLLRAARTMGGVALLAQIDGGEADERLISRLARLRGMKTLQLAPCGYWEQWRDECKIAQRIIVNSDWSRRLLTEAGVDDRKIAVVPVAYECDANAVVPERDYPTFFDHERPLRVLFLGATTLRKGFLETLEAAQQLVEHPVIFSVVGSNPEGLANTHGLLNVTYHGAVPRERVNDFYAKADVFLFPTHSDGFGMTQIEALAMGLPVIASRNCASLVEHGNTGLVLEEVSVSAITKAIVQILESPGQLSEMSREASSFASTLASSANARLLKVVAAHQ